MTRALGIDVSHWDGHVDYNKAKAAGASFVFVKASQWVADPLFAENWGNAKGVLLRGAYHYLDWGWSEVKQAELFVKTMGTDFGELPPVLDLEMNYAACGLSAAAALARAWGFLVTVEKLTGHKPMVYSGYYYANFVTPFRDWTRFPFWLAWYASEAYIKLRTLGTGAPKPWTGWKFWQYTDKGNGLQYGCQSATVDLNVFNGTVDELRAWANPAPQKICPTCGQVIP